MKDTTSLTILDLFQWKEIWDPEIIGSIISNIDVEWDMC